MSPPDLGGSAHGGPDDRARIGPAAIAALSGARVRSLTRSASAVRSTGSIVSLVGDVYSGLVMFVVTLVIVVSAAGQIGVGMTPPEGGDSLDPRWVSLAALLAGAGVVLGLAARLGPLGVGGAGAAWWLPLPADRRGLLRPALAWWPVAGGVVGGSIALVAGALSRPSLSVAGLLALLTAALTGAAIMIAVAGTQTWESPRSRRRVRVLAGIGDALVAIVPGLLVPLAFWRPDAPGWLASLTSASTLDDGVPTGPILVAAGLGVLVLSGWLVVDRRLERVRGADLRSQGARAEHASGAVLSLDPRELGQAMSHLGGRDGRRGSLRLAWVRGPVTALAAADALAWLRSPRHIAQVIATAALPIAMVFSGLVGSPWLLAVLVAACGVAVAPATAQGPKQAQLVPALDSLFALSAAQTRRARLMVPTVGCAAWAAAVLGAIGLMHGDVAMWAAIGLASGPAWAAGAIRAAYRTAPDWGGPLVSTPMGAVPPGAGVAFAQGPDVALLAAAPALIALVTWAPSLTLLGVQAAASLGALVVVSRPDR